MKFSFLVRSLASVSLRKTLNSHAPFHFDYFTVDLNEEYSALFGGVLKEQREFVHHCLHRILELYRNNANKPTSVILIGHSMVCNLVNHSCLVLVYCKNVFLQ
jgi:glycosylphosphatidylinositol deacylase